LGIHQFPPADDVVLASGASFVGQKLGYVKQAGGGEVGRAAQVGFIQALVVATKSIPKEGGSARFAAGSERAERRVEVEGGMEREPVEEGGRVEGDGRKITIEEAVDDSRRRMMFFSGHNRPHKLPSVLRRRCELSRSM
jgi:hypothetical protein